MPGALVATSDMALRTGSGVQTFAGLVGAGATSLVWALKHDEHMFKFAGFPKNSLQLTHKVGCTASTGFSWFPEWSVILAVSDETSTDTSGNLRLGSVSLVAFSSEEKTLRVSSQNQTSLKRKKTPRF